MTCRSAATLKRQLAGAASAIAIALFLSPDACAGEEPATFDIPAQPLSEALIEFARQSRINVVAPKSVTEGRISSPVSGDMEPSEALDRLMQSTGVGSVQSKDGSYILVRAVASAPKEKPIRVAQDTPTPPDRSRSGPQKTETTSGELASHGDDREAEDRERKLDEVTVTGSLIRALAPESSPLDIYTREDILGSGVTTTEQFIRQLPQNFGGGSTEFASVGLPNDTNSKGNRSFGTGANLRGLGSGGTLILLNGARLAPTSTIGDFVDVSMIPVSALERVDVLTDGASSIYGGDAVAGVMNFILRDDYEGAETSVRYGAVTDGDLSEYRLSQTLGTSWNRGNILGTYEYFSRGNLTLADRPEISAPTSNSGVPIPSREAFDLLPKQSRQSVVIALDQDISPSLGLSATGTYSKRNAKSTITSVVAFDATATRSTSESSSLNLGTDYEISERWLVSISANYSQIKNDEDLYPQNGSPGQTNFDSALYSTDVLLNGDLISLPAGKVKAALGLQYRSEDFIYEIDGVGTQRDGRRDVSAAFGELWIPLFSSQNAVPGINRLELSLSGRIDDYSDFGSTSNPKIGVLWSPYKDLAFRSSYSESFNPPPLGRTGDLNRRAIVYPYAFISNVFGLPVQDPALAGSNYLFSSGTASDLQPETSRTFTAGFDFNVNTGTRDWSVEATYYDIDFENRLGTTPIPQNQSVTLAPFIAYDNPSAFPPGTVVFFPTQAELDALFAGLTQTPTLAFGATLDNIGVINNAPLIRNLSSTVTRGLDARVSLRADTDFGRLTASLNANYIIDFQNQAASTTPKIDALNALYNPVDLQLRAQLGVSRNGFSGNLFVNYKGDYHTDETASSQPINSWTTADLTLAYAFQDRQNPLLQGTSVQISVTNLFDEGPPVTPIVDGFQLAGYDPANASPLGRFVALELRKSF